MFTNNVNILGITIRTVPIAVQPFQAKTVGKRPFSLGHFHPPASSFNVSVQKIENTKKPLAFRYIITAKKE